MGVVSAQPPGRGESMAIVSMGTLSEAVMPLHRAISRADDRNGTLPEVDRPLRSALLDLLEGQDPQRERHEGRSRGQNHDEDARHQPRLATLLGLSLGGRGRQNPGGMLFGPG